ncbi:MAG: c-type cytochrome [Roseovarius sp.]
MRGARMVLPAPAGLGGMAECAALLLFWTAIALAVLALAGAPASAQGFTTLKGHGGPITGISVEPLSGRVATASFDNSVGLWRGRTPQWLEGHDAAVTAVLFAAADRVLSASDDLTAIDWNLTTGERRRLAGHRGKVAGVALSADGRLIATAGWDGRVGLWRGQGDPRALRFLGGHAGAVNAVAFAPDGRALYSAAADGTILVHRLHGLGADAQDGDAGTGDAGTGDAGARETDTGDADTGGNAAPRVLARHGFGITTLLLAPDMSWLAYGAVDGATRIIDPDSGATLHDFTLERRPVLALAYHPDSGRLAVGDGQGYVMIIDTRTWRISHDFRVMRRGPVWALAFSPDGQTIYAGGLDEAVYVWPLALIDRFEPALVTASATPPRPAEPMSPGARQFMRRCAICHALTPGPSRKAGPSLHGLFGRRAGTVPGYPYSQTLRQSAIVWTEETIDALFDLGPDGFIPGSKMPTQRIISPVERQELIAFLRAAAGAREN